eukprot:54229-Chlamydomonas_euryale.AAC.7
MMPFWMDSSSVGRPCSVHSPTSASSTRNLATCAVRCVGSAGGGAQQGGQQGARGCRQCRAWGEASQQSVTAKGDSKG